MTQNVCNNFSPRIMSSARYVQFNTKFTTRGVWWQNLGIGKLYATPLWPRCCWSLAPAGVQAFCTALPPFDARLLCVCDSALSAPHSAACSINHHHPSQKGKILHLLYYFFTNSRFDISFKLSSVIRNVAFISALGRKLYRFWMICATLFLPFIFSTRFVKSQDFSKMHISHYCKNN